MKIFFQILAPLRVFADAIASRLVDATSPSRLMMTATALLFVATLPGFAAEGGLP